MVFLIRFQAFDSFDYRVGYASDVQKKLKQYAVYNPCLELIATRDGEEYEENIVHRYLHTFTGGYWNFERDGWYVCAPCDGSIIPYFKEDYDVMKKKIWEFRDTVLSPDNTYDQALWAELNNGSAISSTIRVGDNLVPNKFWEIDEAFLSASMEAALNNNMPDPSTKLGQLINKIESAPGIDYRFKSYCEAREDNRDDHVLTASLLKYYPNSEYENLYSYFGFDKCQSVSFQLAVLREIFRNDTLAGDLKAKIFGAFKINHRYLLSEAKESLRAIYQELGLHSKNPDASDLVDYFNVKLVEATDKTGKRAKAYLLISLK